jgi:hypothetical protein
VELALRECARRLKTHISKKKKLKKTREKFELIQKVLPAIAEKSSQVLGKKVPSIDAVVSKIMNIVYVEQEIKFVLEDPETNKTAGNHIQAASSDRSDKGEIGGRARTAREGKGSKAKTGSTTLDAFAEEGGSTAEAGDTGEEPEGVCADRTVVVNGGNGLPPGTGVIMVDGKDGIPEGVTIPVSKGLNRVRVWATNYTPKPKNMTLAVKIGDRFVKNASPKPSQIKDALIMWDFDKVASAGVVELIFDVVGLDKGDMDEVEVFYKRVTGEVIGADTL